MTSLPKRLTLADLPAPVAPEEATTTISDESINPAEIAGAAANAIDVA